MGQAKNRGSREKRMAQSVENNLGSSLLGLISKMEEYPA